MTIGDGLGSPSYERERSAGDEWRRTRKSVVQKVATDWEVRRTDRMLCRHLNLGQVAS